jgi:general L-amino acid transport system substrate-binding protein
MPLPKMICAQSGTTTEVNLADFFRNARLTYKVTTFATADEAGRDTDVSPVGLSSCVVGVAPLGLRQGSPLGEALQPRTLI